MKARPFLSAVIACLCGFAVQMSVGEEPALSEAKRSRMDVDLIFVNGNVYTVNERQPHAEAVAVKNERIAFVGSNDDAKKFHAAQIVDLHGKTVVPGLTDSHCHVFGIGVSQKNAPSSGSSAGAALKPSTLAMDARACPPSRCEASRANVELQDTAKAVSRRVLPRCSL